MSTARTQRLVWASAAHAIILTLTVILLGAVPLHGVAVGAVVVAGLVAEVPFLGSRRDSNPTLRTATGW